MGEHLGDTGASLGPGARAGTLAPVTEDEAGGRRCTRRAPDGPMNAGGPMDRAEAESL